MATTRHWYAIEYPHEQTNVRDERDSYNPPLSQLILRIVNVALQSFSSLRSTLIDPDIYLLHLGN
jgi:hypothetical protein